MKSEMRMLPNGNYESVDLYIQHECTSKCYNLICRQYLREMDKLYLEIEVGDPYEDGYSGKFEVVYCPFCGYCPKK